MGVSGVGKSTVGKALAKALDVRFIEGDDYHPLANIDKMRSGHPLTDEDRSGWLDALVLELARSHEGAVLACSALKQSYRDRLYGDRSQAIIFVYLDAPKESIASRLARRKGHFMPPSLLDSQFEALEPPEDAIRIDARWNIKRIVQTVQMELEA
jgi:carbohydrate kinase (thermoresistant glucokinase family)